MNRILILFVETNWVIRGMRVFEGGIHDSSRFQGWFVSVNQVTSWLESHCQRSSCNVEREYVEQKSKHLETCLDNRISIMAAMLFIVASSSEIERWGPVEVLFLYWFLWKALRNNAHMNILRFTFQMKSDPHQNVRVVLMLYWLYDLFLGYNFHTVASTCTSKSPKKCVGFFHHGSDFTNNKQLDNKSN